MISSFSLVCFILFHLSHACKRPASILETDRVQSYPALKTSTLKRMEKLHEVYENHPGMRHPFWDFFAQGEFDLDFVKQFALYYYEHVRFFRKYLAGAMTVIPVEEFEAQIAETLADEYGIQLHGEPMGVPSHPELYRMFMRSLGLTEDDWKKYSDGTYLIPGIRYFRQAHFSLFKAEMVEETIGAVVFGLERPVPYFYSAVMVGLQKFAAREEMELDVQFWSEHVGVDDWHSASLVQTLEDKYFQDDASLERIKWGIETSLNARKVEIDDLAFHLGVNLSEQPKGCIGKSLVRVECSADQSTF